MNIPLQRILEMRLLIPNTDYPSFLADLYASHPGLATRSYDEQMAVRNDSRFGTADFFSKHLRSLGHTAWDVHANNDILQQRWCEDHNRPGLLGRPRTLVELWDRVTNPVKLRTERTLDVIRQQIEELQPDVIYNQCIDWGPISSLLGEIRQRRGSSQFPVITGQIAAPIPQGIDFSGYDLILSSLPNYVEQFRQQGLNAEFFRLGFEDAIAKEVKVAERDVPVSFVGSISPAHADRFRWLTEVCQAIHVEVWSADHGQLPLDSPIRRALHPAVWGREMYRVLARSRITLNFHIGIAGNFANNMRLFEATGMGSLLITDAKANLHELFEPDQEVVTYRSIKECVEKIRYYLSHDEDRQRIAAAGQQRTLRDHNWRVRMEELSNILTRWFPELASR